MTSLDDILGTASVEVVEPPIETEVKMTETVTESVPANEFAARVAQADDVLDKLLARISSVSDAVPYRKMLLYGPFGVGKTVFCATAPKPLIVRVEPTGTLSLQNHPDLEAKTKTFQFISVFQLETLLDKIEEIGSRDGVSRVHELFGETLIIDSFSELQKFDLDDILKKAAASDASRNKYLPTGPDYNVNTEHMRQIASKLERIPMHVIVTCHVKEEKNEATGQILVRPNLTPKLAGTLAGKFDVVAYMAMNGNGADAVRTLQCTPTATIMSKTRIGGLPPILESPTFDALFASAKS